MNDYQCRTVHFLFWRYFHFGRAEKMLPFSSNYFIITLLRLNKPITCLPQTTTVFHPTSESYSMIWKQTALRCASLSSFCLLFTDSIDTWLQLWQTCFFMIAKIKKTSLEDPGLRFCRPCSPWNFGTAVASVTLKHRYGLQGLLSQPRCVKKRKCFAILLAFKAANKYFSMACEVLHEDRQKNATDCKVSY